MQYLKYYIGLEILYCRFVQIPSKLYKTEIFFLVFTFFKMILFVYFLATVTAIPNDDLYQKLKNYQNLTGIPNEEFNLLWQKQYDSSKYIF